MERMKYDFNTVTPRRGTCSYKWDTAEGKDLLPMWVADMDFRTAPAIIKALQDRVAHGIFGYTKVPEEYYRAVTSWFERRHNWTIDPRWMIYTSGVVPALSAIIKAMTVPGDKVIVQTPAFNCFFSSIRNNGCELSANRLLLRDGRYFMDFDDLERQAADPRAKVMVLCNPHNPGGRVWTADELRKMGEICLRNGVFVIADEIHCEFTFNGHDYTPYAALSPQLSRNCAVCVSPSKAFNIAGLQIANIVAEDDETRRKIDRAINDNEVCDVNPFGVLATIAAYNEGEEWLDELRQYIWDNYLHAADFFAKRLPNYSIMPLEGTYLLWIDCHAAGMEADEIEQRLEKEQGLMLSPGTMFGPGGEHFMRMNIACPRQLLDDGLQRFENFERQRTL